MGASKESGNPLNIDPKTWRVATDQSRFGNGFKKVERRVLPGAKPQDGDTPFWQQFPVPDQEVYASGMSNCGGLILTPEDLRNDEEL
jgi:hypothetical protein